MSTTHPDAAGPLAMTVTASYAGKVLARAERTVFLEGNHYFPPETVDDGVLEKSWVRTLCYWKGIARYYDVHVDGDRISNAAWAYPVPSPAGEEDQEHGRFRHGHRDPHPGRTGMNGTDLGGLIGLVGIFGLGSAPSRDPGQDANQPNPRHADKWHGQTGTSTDTGSGPASGPGREGGSGGPGWWWAGVAGGVTAILCCAGPTVLALIGAMSAATAFTLANDLYEKWNWAFRLAGLAVTGTLLWWSLHRRKACRVAGLRGAWKRIAAAGLTGVAVYVCFYWFTTWLGHFAS
ncbi:DUF427 domain-containing protein [Arthrobacter bambusae]|uniref:DUF427 domain-containing protein n=1 Tax=Arthrobacter bambusae TaxID=1338426 RepID=UPI00278186C6|nr:DUF427 domain-containing protein [Arthrobacter bambusae]MDQ0213108.1 uncharacterized protein (DUF427 family) [Arthrobacter bambusae]MDQ0237442.1 uncharacterized protein (DUF427 family) [Arthrobacter bambusae]